MHAYLKMLCRRQNYKSTNLNDEEKVYNRKSTPAHQEADDDCYHSLQNIQLDVRQLRRSRISCSSSLLLRLSSVCIT